MICHKCEFQYNKNPYLHIFLLLFENHTVQHQLYSNFSIFISYLLSYLEYFSLFLKLPEKHINYLK